MQEDHIDSLQHIPRRKGRKECGTKEKKKESFRINALGVHKLFYAFPWPLRVCSRSPMR